MPSKTLLAIAGASTFACALVLPFASRATDNSEIARRSWINTLNQDLKAGINSGPIKGLSYPAPSSVPDWFLLEPSRT